MAMLQFLDLASKGQQLDPAFAAYCPFGMRDVPGPAMGFTVVPWGSHQEKHSILQPCAESFGILTRHATAFGAKHGSWLLLLANCLRS